MDVLSYLGQTWTGRGEPWGYASNACWLRARNQSLPLVFSVWVTPSLAINTFDQHFCERCHSWTHQHPPLLLAQSTAKIFVNIKLNNFSLHITSR